MNKVSAPSVGVGCIIKHPDGRFLLVKRTGSHGEGTWSTPGGFLEFGEALEDCAARESKEETGVKVQNIRFHAVTNDIFPDDNKHFVTVWMAADYASGVPIPSDESTEVGWFARENLPTGLFLSLDNLIKHYGLP